MKQSPSKSPRADSAASERAREAMLRRGRKSDNTMLQYYLVIGAFIAVCVAAVVYVLLNPKQPFSQMPVINESQILVHNGAGSQYQQGANDLFVNWTLSDAKQLFKNALSDTNQISPCKTKEETETIIPEKYDWREQHPDCVMPVENQGNCSSSYISATLSTVSDRICATSNKQVPLSTHEILHCEKNSYGCEGGYPTRVLNYGKRKGFTPRECLDDVKTEECDDIQTANTCRANNTIYKVIDYCLAIEEDGIKKEILKNGPVIAQMTVFTDFLVYKEGLYHRTEDSFKFNGMQIVKIVGWDKREDGNDYWVVQNSFGADWGEDGFVRVLAQDKSTGLDSFALGVAVYPMTMAEYYDMQENFNIQTQAGA